MTHFWWEETKGQKVNTDQRRRAATANRRVSQPVWPYPPTPGLNVTGGTSRAAAWRHVLTEDADTSVTVGQQFLLGLKQHLEEEEEEPDRAETSAVDAQCPQERADAQRTFSSYLQCSEADPTFVKGKHLKVLQTREVLLGPIVMSGTANQSLHVQIIV